MKKRFISFLFIASGILFGSYSANQLHSQTPVQSNAVKQQTVKYTCPMHPEVTKDKLDKCPQCGMALVAKKDYAKKNMAHDSTMMHQRDMKMKHDSTSMQKGRLMNDTTSMKKKRMSN